VIGVAPQFENGKKGDYHCDTPVYIDLSASFRVNNYLLLGNQIFLQIFLNYTLGQIHSLFYN